MATITDVPLYKGETDGVAVGVLEPHFITIPAGQYQRLSINTKIPKHLEAPITKGDKVGELIIEFDKKPIETEPLFALQSVPQGGFFKRCKDAIRLTFSNWFGS